MLFRRRFLIFLIACFEVFSAAAQTDTCRFQISLLTCGPGEDLYSMWGHTAIRVRNRYNRTDYVFNYGTFDDSDPYFYVKFTRGIMRYSLSVETMSEFMQEYVIEQRSVQEQILQLSCSEKEKLVKALEQNALEANRYYNYHFYQDNCTLRARDIIANNCGNKVSYKNILPYPHITFRNAINGYLDQGGQLWSKFGINVLLGSHLDKEMDNQNAMFLPDYLFKGFDSASNGNTRLVSEAKNILPPNTNHSGSAWITPSLVFTVLLIIGLILSLSRSSRFKTLTRIFDIIVFFCIGLLGILIAALWLGRVDAVCRNNINILWAWPTHAIVIFLAARKKAWIRNYFLVAASLGIILLLGWKWWPQELPTAALPIVFLVVVRSIFIAQKK